MDTVENPSPPQAETLGLDREAVAWLKMHLTDAANVFDTLGKRLGFLSLPGSQRRVIADECEFRAKQFRDGLQCKPEDIADWLERWPDAILAATAVSQPPTSCQGENRGMISADDAEKEANESYDIGVRDGIEEGVQKVALAFGLDGEYRCSTDPDRHVPDHQTMIARIVEHAEALASPRSPHPWRRPWRKLIGRRWWRCGCTPRRSRSTRTGSWVKSASP